MSADAGTESRVITADVTDPHDIKASFDLILYKKVSFSEIADIKAKSGNLFRAGAR